MRDPADHGTPPFDLGCLLHELGIGPDFFHPPAPPVPAPCPDSADGHRPFLAWLAGALRPRRAVLAGDGLGEACREALDQAGLAAAVLPPGAAPADLAPGSLDLLQLAAGAAPPWPGSWAGALSDRGVLLLHGTRRPGAAEALAAWQALAARHPHVEFEHGGGLGVLAMGGALPPALRRFFAAGADPARRDLLQGFFAAQGAAAAALRQGHAAQAEALTLRDALRAAGQAARQAGAAAAAERIALVEARAAAERAALAARQEAELLRRELALLRDSSFWRATAPLRRLAGLLPPRLRRMGRAGGRLLGWAVTLQLRRRLRERRALQEAGPVIAMAPALLLPLPPQGRRPDAAELAAMAWPDTAALRAHRPRARIAVVLHLFYPELWEEFAAALGALPEPFDLFVSLVQGHAEPAEPAIRAAFPGAVVLVFPNHGRDVYPFVALAGAGALSGYELVCKLHSKRSPHRADGDAWRRSLTAGLLRDAGHVRAILGAFRADPDLGIVVARGGIAGGDAAQWHANLVHVRALSARIGLPPLTAPRPFPGGSVFWIRPFLLRPLAGAGLAPGDFEAEPLPVDGTAAHAVERLIGLICHEAGMRMAEEQEIADAAPLPASLPILAPVEVVAFYRPQPPPPPPEEAGGGEAGDWGQVARARPLFPGHRQPRLPGGLGFCDQRLPAVQAAQAALARRHGVSAFCYRLRWSDGAPLSEAPLAELARGGGPELPFMLCWDNAAPRHRGEGPPDDLPLPQRPAPGWQARFARAVAPLLRDRRCWRQDGRPLLLIEDVGQLPDPAAALAALRRALREAGPGEVHLAAGWTAATPGGAGLPEAPAALGLDAYVELPPACGAGAREVTGERLPPRSGFRGRVHDYASLVDAALAGLALPRPGPRHRVAAPGRDDTARRGAEACILHGANPASFRRWLRGLVREAAARPGPGPRLVFVEAWNDWAGGAALEPDGDFGLGWLEAVASALPAPPRFPSPPEHPPQD